MLLNVLEFNVVILFVVISVFGIVLVEIVVFLMVVE